MSPFSFIKTSLRWISLSLFPIFVFIEIALEYKSLFKSKKVKLIFYGACLYFLSTLFSMISPFLFILIKDKVLIAKIMSVGSIVTLIFDYVGLLLIGKGIHSQLMLTKEIMISQP